jgi:hypothetical protein
MPSAAIVISSYLQRLVVSATSPTHLLRVLAQQVSAGDQRNYLDQVTYSRQYKPKPDAQSTDYL